MASLGQLLRALLVSLTLLTFGIAETTTAETTTSDSATTTTASSTSTGKATHTIKVGAKTSPHGYDPDHIYADPGDLVIFEFWPTNHSVVKADYGAPCVPASENVFYSGQFNDFDQKDGQIIGDVRW